MFLNSRLVYGINLCHCPSVGSWTLHHGAFLVVRLRISSSVVCDESSLLILLFKINSQRSWQGVARLAHRDVGGFCLYVIGLSVPGPICLCIFWVLFSFASYLDSFILVSLPSGEWVALEKIGDMAVLQDSSFDMSLGYMANCCSPDVDWQ